MAADRKTLACPEGETRIGPNDPQQKTAQGVFYVSGSNIPSKGSVLALDGVTSGGVCTTWYLFVTSAGVLRIDDELPDDTEADGSAV
jgi:hypothetical protein